MKIINLEKNMGSFQLKIDHLDIEPGKVHGLVGHNGCGKTILLKTIIKKHPINVIIPAKNTCPIPHARPIVIAKNTHNISFEVPGILLNLTKLII